MKKLLSLLLAVAMLLALAACGAKSAADSPADEPENTVSDNAAQAAPDEAPDPSEPEAPNDAAEEPPQETVGETTADTAEPPSGQTTEQMPAEPEPATTPDAGGKILVAYFSATGSTKSVAETLRTALDADLYEIVPEDPYTAADLDYNSDCRANREQNDDSARPAISGSVSDMGDYAVVFVGYPIWWGKEPKIIDTFLESYDFSGKTVVPFCTSGGSGISGSLSGVRAGAAGANVLDGKRFSGGVSVSDAEDWVNGLDLTK